jgi:decaprenyl-phosphate phosphoribosyltransferase
MPGAPEAPAGDRRRAARSLNPRALLRAARPRQWVKNLLVFAAPAAAGDLGHRWILGRAAGAAAVFCLASIGAYLVNDAADVVADSLHPIKRRRPVAAGEVPPRLATTTGAVLLAVSVALAAVLAGRALAIVMACYAVVNLAYTFWLKRVPVVELGCVSAGFVLRAVAGGAATGVPLSVWFVTVACFGSLLVTAGKRTGEIHELGEDGAGHRPALGSYPLSFLRSVRIMASTVLVTTYCLWAFDRSARPPARPHAMLWYELSIVPVVLAVLYLEFVFESGRGAAPEELALGDRTLQVLGITWIGLLAVGIYAA